MGLSSTTGGMERESLHSKTMPFSKDNLPMMRWTDQGSLQISLETNLFQKELAYSRTAISKGKSFF